MRITSANIPTQVSRPQSTHPSNNSADQVAKRQQALREDSYQRTGSTSAPFIDAEYVEFYTPPAKNFTQERQALDSRIELETADAETLLAHSASSKTGQYQLQHHQAPPPGTYVDTFA